MEVGSVRQKRVYARKVEKNQRHCDLVTCCGMTFPAGMRHKHESGLLHNSQRIQALAAQPCMTDAEIARRIGCSRERVRQIVKQLGGIAASNRATTCEFNSEEHFTKRARARALTHPLLSAFTQAADANGADWKLIAVSKPALTFCLTKLEVNGRIIALKKTNYHPRGYVRLSPERKHPNAEFAAYLLQPTGDWFIIPRLDLPQYNTLFALEPNLDGIGFTQNRRHDWPKYKNAWHLLK